jgi:APA family basic amino acid/polyamine antiporter
MAGPAALLAFVLAFGAALTIALPYAELSCRFPRAGGTYAATRATLGPSWGFVTGWGYWGAWVGVSGVITLGFAGYLEVLTGLPRVLGALALVVAITGWNLYGTRLTGRVQALVVGIGAAVLLGLGVSGVPTTVAHAAQLAPVLPNGLGGLLAALPPAFLALTGFDTVAAAGEEVIRPERTLPRAILLTLAIAVSLYLLVAGAALGARPWSELGASPAPLADVADALLGPAGSRLVTSAALLTTAMTANAALVVGSRVVFAMARDGMLPRAAAHVHATTGAPRVAVLLTGAMLALVAATGTIALAAAVGGFLYVLHYLPTLASLVRLQRRGGATPAFATPLPGLVIPLAGGACLLLLYAAGTAGLMGGVCWLLAGVTVVLIRRRATACRWGAPLPAARGTAHSG